MLEVVLSVKLILALVVLLVQEVNDLRLVRDCLKLKELNEACQRSELLSDPYIKFIFPK